MTQELSQKLKDAGFPIKNIGWDHGYEEDLRFPTLSELIEACGKSFGTLDKIPITKLNHGKWSCRRRYAQEVLSDIEVVGDTPEEAVANLYISLSVNNILP